MIEKDEFNKVCAFVDICIWRVGFMCWEIHKMSMRCGVGGIMFLVLSSFRGKCHHFL